MLIIICAVLLVMNLLSFAMMGIDKMKARRGSWRIPEKMLFLVTALFGGLGGTLGMQVFRHKTKHWYFKWGFPALLVLQAALLLVILPRLM